MILSQKPPINFTKSHNHLEIQVFVCACVFLNYMRAIWKVSSCKTVTLTMAGFLKK